METFFKSKVSEGRFGYILSKLHFADNSIL